MVRFRQNIARSSLCYDFTLDAMLSLCYFKKNFETIFYLNLVELVENVSML